MKGYHKLTLYFLFSFFFFSCSIKEQEQAKQLKPFNEFLKQSSFVDEIVRENADHVVIEDSLCLNSLNIVLYKYNVDNEGWKKWSVIHPDIIEAHQEVGSSTILLDKSSKKYYYINGTVIFNYDHPWSPEEFKLFGYVGSMMRYNNDFIGLNNFINQSDSFMLCKNKMVLLDSIFNFHYFFLRVKDQYTKELKNIDQIDVYEKEMTAYLNGFKLPHHDDRYELDEKRFRDQLSYFKAKIGNPDVRIYHMGDRLLLFELIPQNGVNGLPYSVNKIIIAPFPA